MKNTISNRYVIKKIAVALGSLNRDVVFVGGAVVSLYINDPAAEDIRPTKDIDITAKIASAHELERLRKALLEKGFRHDTEDGVICRFRFEDVKVDVMSTKEVGWAPSDKWFAPGFKNMQAVDVDGYMVNILPLPYFLAAKFSAHYDRGGSDPRASHDFEDIVYIMDNRVDLVEQVKVAPPDVETYLKEQFSALLSSDMMKEAVEAHLFYETRARRFELILEKLGRIVA